MVVLSLLNDLRPARVIINSNGHSLYNRFGVASTFSGGGRLLDIAVPADDSLGYVQTSYPVRGVVSRSVEHVAEALSDLVGDDHTVRLVLTAPISIEWRFPGWKVFTDIVQHLLIKKRTIHLTVYLMVCKTHYSDNDDTYTENPMRERIALDKLE